MGRTLCVCTLWVLPVAACVYVECFCFACSCASDTPQLAGGLASTYTFVHQLFI